MNKKLTTILLAFLVLLIGKAEAATLTQYIGEMYISQMVNEGQQVRMRFVNQTGYTFNNWIVESGNISIDTANPTVTFTMPSSNVIIRANYKEITTSCTHNYTSKITTAATCGANGVRTYTCSLCGDSYPETIAATGNHSYTSVVTTQPTCASRGYTKYTCSICSNSYSAEYTEATGMHIYEDVRESSTYLRSEATCTEDATYYYKCISCEAKSTAGDKYWVKTGTALGHNFSYGIGYDTHLRSEATCTENETYWYCCANGDCRAISPDKYWEAGDTATGHTEENVIVDATYHEKVCITPGCGYRSGELVRHRFVDGYDYCYNQCGKTNEHPEHNGEIKGTIINGVVKIEWEFPQYDDFYILIFDRQLNAIVNTRSLGDSCVGSVTVDVGKNVYGIGMYEIEYVIDGVSYGWLNFGNGPELTQGVETIIFN